MSEKSNLFRKSEAASWTFCCIFPPEYEVIGDRRKRNIIFWWNHVFFGCHGRLGSAIIKFDPFITLEMIEIGCFKYSFEKFAKLKSNWNIYTLACVYSCLQNGDVLLILSCRNCYDSNKIFLVNKQDEVSSFSAVNC